jgi:DNA processing protein
VGTGIDACYPKENKKLCEEVLDRGAIVSEFPIGSHPAPENFPDPESHHRRHADRRHHCGGQAVQRLLDHSAAGHGVMEFGREVSGVPGNVTQDVSFAPNLLIKQGAKLVTNAEDLIEELPTPVRAALVQLEAVESEQRNLLVADGLTPTEKKIYEPLSAEESRPI